ncbi:zinc finger protein 692 isoform X1 [Prionailurus iriomotensis]
MASSPVDASRRRQEKRRQLDARRSKCRIRLGGHMEQWCLLKERLGFSLHSQLAKFLLDRYTSSGCVLCAGPEPLPPKGLQYLVLLSHAHSRECSLVPGLRGPGGQDGGLVWECSAGHTFSWGPSSGPISPEEPKPVFRPSTAPRSWCPEARSGQAPAGSLCTLLLPKSPPTTSDLRSTPVLIPPAQSSFPFDPTGLESEHDERTQEARSPSREVGPLLETFPPPGEEGEEEDEDEEEMLSEASPWTYSSSPDEQVGGSDPDAPRLLPSPVTHTLKEGETPPAPAALLNPLAVPSSSTSSSGALPTEVGVQPELRGTPQAAQQTEPLASPGIQRIRKAAKRELLPCDFPGCGRIFSNRQYLNVRNVRGTDWVLCGFRADSKSMVREPGVSPEWHFVQGTGPCKEGCGKKHHKKYQHIHQKSFSCPEPACGKSFNFKKHLKEHVKLHSDTRDYICEFCARSFRTSSNLVIHRRIHTGEKPLQCEICGFTCRQKASLNWHRRKHAETAATLRFPCEFCGKRFEKPDSVAAHCSKSHPALLPAPQESPGPLEPCPNISASVTLRSDDESRPSLVPEALTTLHQQ